MYCSGKIDVNLYRAWLKIAQDDEQLVWEGNKELLYYEQFAVLQPTMYEKHSNTWWLVDSQLSEFFKGNQLTSPVPGHNTEKFPGSNIAIFEERWKWIENSILPAWQTYETNPNNSEELRREHKKYCSTCCN